MTATYLLFSWEPYEAKGGFDDLIGEFTGGDAALLAYDREVEARRGQWYRTIELWKVEGKCMKVRVHYEPGPSPDELGGPFEPK